jgi:hypothetical protein
VRSFELLLLQRRGLRELHLDGRREGPAEAVVKGGDERTAKCREALVDLLRDPLIRDTRLFVGGAESPVVGKQRDRGLVGTSARGAAIGSGDELGVILSSTNPSLSRVACLFCSSFARMLSAAFM